MSRRLRLRDLRKIYNLIGECRELGADPAAWWSHLLCEAGRLVNAPVSTGGQVDGWRTTRATGAKPHPVLVLDMGWSDAGSHELFQHWIRYDDVRSDPLYDRLCNLPRKLTTRCRRQIISSREWYGSIHYNEYRKQGGIDDCIYSRYTFPGGDLVQTLCVHRVPEDQQFTERERRLIHWLHHEVAVIVGGPLVSPHRDPLSNLSPRLRQTLLCLLEGDSEKQVALRLKLSRETVHDYVKALYRRFGVRSRSELLALWIRLTNRPRPDAN